MRHTPTPIAPAHGAHRCTKARLVRLVFVAILAVLGTGGRGGRSSQAQTPDPTAPSALELHSVLDGRSEAVAYRSPYLYLGVGPRLVVLDASDPTAPIQVGASPLLAHLVTGLELEGDVAHVLLDLDAGGHTTMVCTLGLANPTAPALLGCLALEGPVWAIAVEGPVLYAAGNAGLAVVDVSDPATPVRLTSVALSDGAVAVVAGGDRVFVGVPVAAYRLRDGSSYQGPGYRVFDVSDPGSPRDLGILNEALENGRRSIDRLAIRGSIAYALDHGGLSVYDVSDPLDTALVGRIDLGTLSGLSSSRLAVGIDRVWVVNPPADASIVVVDVADPSAPTVRASLISPTPFYRRNGAVPVGDRLVLARQLGGYSLLDTSDPAVPDLSVPFAPFGYVTGTALLGDRLLVALPERGLGVVDVADAAAPVVLALAGVDATRVVVRDGYAYTVAPGTLAVPARLDVYDLADLDRPVLARTLAPAASASTLALDGDRLYVGGTALEVYDVAEPSAPALLGAMTLTDGAMDLVVANGFAHVSDSSARLITVDATDPATPRETARLTLPDWTAGIALDGDRLLVATQRRGLVVIDATNSALPVLELNVPDLGWLHDVAVSDGHVWVATGVSLVAIDRADLGDPDRWTTVALPIVPFHLIHQVGRIVASGEGIALLGSPVVSTAEPTSPAPPTPEATAIATATTEPTLPASRVVGRVFLPSTLVGVPVEDAWVMPATP